MMEMTKVNSNNNNGVNNNSSPLEQQDQEGQVENGVVDGANHSDNVPSSFDDNVHSLPTIEELMTGKRTGKSRIIFQRRIEENEDEEEAGDYDDYEYINHSNDGNAMLILFCCLFTILVGTSVGAGLGVHQKNLRDIAQEEYRKDVRFRHIVNYMGNHSISDYQSMLTAGSPQNLAANWIAHEDELALDVPVFTSNPQTNRNSYDFVVRYILAVVYYAMGGNSTWTKDLNFLSADHYCEWYQLIVQEYATFPRGVACTDASFSSSATTTSSSSNHHRRITIEALFLDNNGLSGSIPKEMGHLTTLQILDLDWNSIVGTMPTTLNRLSQLQHLSITQNSLTGEFPIWFHRLPNLLTLDLSYNFLVGHLPRELVRMENLLALALDHNAGLTGDINRIFGSFAATQTDAFGFDIITGKPYGNLQLQALYLEDNNFTTTTLDDNFLRGMNQLERFDISGNQLKGSLPQHLFFLPSLQVLDLHNNQLTGNLPNLEPTIYTNHNNTTKLTYLALHQNQLTGSIPTSWGNRLSQLEHLDLSQNLLNATMPQNDVLHFWTHLKYLFLAQNNFVPGTIPESLATLTNLQELSLKSTQRTGTVPADLFRSLEKLILLDLDNNQFTGTLPTTLGLLSNIQFLLLNDNQFTGPIPAEELNRLYELRLLFLDQNELTGSLDTTICNKPPNSFMPYIISDCGDHSTIPATDVEIVCNCCFKCCSNDKPCNDNEFIPSNDPMWQFGYQRVFYVFGDRISWFATSTSQP